MGASSCEKPQRALPEAKNKEDTAMREKPGKEKKKKKTWPTAQQHPTPALHRKGQAEADEQPLSSPATARNTSKGEQQFKNRSKKEECKQLQQILPRGLRASPLRVFLGGPSLPAYSAPAMTCILQQESPSLAPLRHSVCKGETSVA